MGLGAAVIGSFEDLGDDADLGGGEILLSSMVLQRFIEADAALLRDGLGSSYSRKALRTGGQQGAASICAARVLRATRPLRESARKIELRSLDRFRVVDVRAGGINLIACASDVHVAIVPHTPGSRARDGALGYPACESQSAALAPQRDRDCQRFLAGETCPAPGVGGAAPHPSR